MKTPDSSVQRKENNEQYLKTLGIPVNPHLPHVESENEAKFRNPEEVAKRALVLYALISVAHQADRELAVSWLKNEDLWQSVSPKEKAFLENSTTPEREVIEASWRVESLWTLLWSLGKVEELGLPKELCDSDLIQQIMPEPEMPIAQFINQASLRPPSEILDATDLIYRIHWADVDARLNNRETPGGLYAGIIYERHYTLNWLTWYAKDWDDIITDT